MPTCFDSIQYSRGETMNARQAVVWPALAALCCFAAAGGCVAPGDDGHPDSKVALARQALIGGFPADGTEFDAIGAVTTERSFTTGNREPICTATLIAPTLVVTAKHCTRGSTPLYFAIGSAGGAPSREVAVIAIERGPDVEGDYPKGLGNDVAVLHLAESITEPEPLAWKQLTDADVGAEFISIGYGLQDVAGSSGTRRMAQAQLRARSGRGLEAVYGSFDGYFERFLEALKRSGITCREAEAREKSQASTTPVVPSAVVTPAEEDDGQCSPEYLQHLHARYDGFLLETAGQLLVTAPSDGGQACFGDSGGPLLRTGESGALETYGVVSWGMGSDELPCDYGTFYTSFDSPKRELLMDAPSWVDPCGGISADGICEGAVATRCTTATEGSRRLLHLDCAELHLDCQPRANGSVGCGEAGPVPDAPEAPDPDPIVPPPPIVGAPPL